VLMPAPVIRLSIVLLAKCSVAYGSIASLCVCVCPVCVCPGCLHALQGSGCYVHIYVHYLCVAHVHKGIEKCTAYRYLACVGSV